MTAAVAHRSLPTAVWWPSSRAPSNWVPGDTNFAGDVFVRDLVAGTIRCVSVTPAGVPANRGGSIPVISANGRFVAFFSNSTDLVTGGGNFEDHVFVRDLQAGTTEQVDVSSSGEPSNGFVGGFPLGISADGRFVVFDSTGTNLVPEGSGNQEVYLRDRKNHTTEIVSLGRRGAFGDRGAYGPAISGNGRYVAFTSTSTNLVRGDTNDVDDIFVRDRQSGTTKRVSLSTTGRQGDGASNSPTFSPGGRFIAFVSRATNLVAGDTNSASDVFLHDSKTGTTRRVSVATDGSQGDANSSFSTPAAVSAQGRVVAFSSDATNLVPHDGNLRSDVFVRVRAP